MTNESNAPIYQLRFQLTREDVAAFEFLPRELVGWEKLWLFGPILVLGAAVGFFEDQLSAVLPWDPGTRWGQLALVLVAIAIGYALSLVLLTARTRYRIANTPLPATPTRIEVYPEAFFVSEDDDENRSYVWSEATVIETSQHIFIKQGSRRPVIIPLRAFSDANGMANFAAMARALGREDDQQDLVDDVGCCDDPDKPRTDAAFPTR